MSKYISLTINNKKYGAKDDLTILEVCQQNDIHIPTLCNDEMLKPVGACRMCIVEIEGNENLFPSCSTKVADGIKISTESPKVKRARKEILELIWANHEYDCLVCKKSGECKLQDYCYQYDITPQSYYEFDSRKDYDINYSNKFFYSNPNRCILCGKCVRICDELQNTNAIDFINRGSKTYVGYPLDGRYESSVCVSCGNCVSICPVGALMPKNKIKFRNWEVRKVKTTCGYCGVGCQIELVIKNNKVVRVDPVKDGPNDGLLCVKGKFAYNFINHKDRLKSPLIKRNGKFEKASWDEALSLIVNKINETKELYGSDSLAGLSSAKCTNEENYLMQKFVRVALGTNNVDHCARLCHASTVTGLANTLGSGAMTNSIAEVKDNDVTFVIGSNTTETHPVIGSMILQAKRKGAKIIVADPREIVLAKKADIYLQIYPGSNVALINSMCNVIYHEKLYDTDYIENRTEEFEAFINVIKDYTPEIAAPICGVSAEDIKIAARIYARGSKSAIYYAMGITQHSNGTDNVKSLANLAMMCGNIGIEGGGINPLRGQNNVQGACDLGALPNTFSGYQKVFDDRANEKFQKAWGSKLSKDVGLTVTTILSAALSGKIKMLYIMGENPVVSDPDTKHVIKSLENLDFLVVQDIFLTETAEYANVILPAVSFAEKDGTFTNTERRIQRIRKAVSPIGDAKADWEILCELFYRLGYPAEYESPSDIMDEISTLTPIYRGISYNRIDEHGLQWPCTSDDHPGTKYLHKDKMARGKGLFTAINYNPPFEMPNKEYPFILTTGRTLYHFHTRTMTKRTKGINEIVGGNYLEISENTAKQLKVSDGDILKITSRRGSTNAVAKIVDDIKDGVTFMTFHFENGANVLTNSEALDKESNIPELKVSAVRIEHA